MEATIVRGVIGFLILLGIGVLAVVLYGLFYRKHINRALKDDEAPAPVPEPRGTWKVVLFLLLLVCFGLWEAHKMEKLHELNDRLASVQNDCSTLERKINDVQWQLEEQKEEQERVFLSFDWETRDVDFRARTATVDFRAVPKEASEEAEVSLSLREKRYRLLRGEDGVYRASATVNPFEFMTNDEESAFLALTMDGKSQNEMVSFYAGFEQSFPKVDVWREGGVTHEEKTGKVILEALLYVQNPDPAEIRGLRLLVKQKGSVLEEVDLTQSLGKESADAPLHGEYPDTDDLEVYLRWEDNYGLTHETLRWVFHVEDAVIEECYGEEAIYDADGTLLGEIWGG